MTDDDVLAAEERFFDALVRAGGSALEGALNTHVYVRDGTGWRLASAQGTPIAPAEPA